MILRFHPRKKELMKISLCNEVIREMDFPAQCDFARKLGYDGLELAPFTLDENPHLLGKERRAELRRAAAEAGVTITGLHWLLVTPQGLSINSPDKGVRNRTVEVMRALIELCADVGGKVLVHGSPKQRMVANGDSLEEAWKRACDTFSAVAGDAEAANLIYCIEPLAPSETNFINSVAEGVRLVEAVGHPAFLTMIDCCASAAETLATPDLMERWLPTGKVAHIHFNDANRRGPGQGETRFEPIIAVLRRHNYQGIIGVEPFEYVPDGPSSAARAIGYIRGIMEG
jgi:D-psicose/D-tagatose/L-ribulose 3-epimerase